MSRLKTIIPVNMIEPLWRQSFLIVACLIFLFSISLPLTCLILALLSVLILAIKHIGNKIKINEKKKKDMVASSYNIALESFQHIPTIKAFTYEKKLYGNMYNPYTNSHLIF